MKNNKLVLIAGLVLLMALISQWMGGPDTMAPPESGQALLSPEQVAQADLIRLESASQVVTLEHLPGGWVIKEKNSFPIQASKLVKLMDELTQAKTSSLISQKPEDLEAFHLVFPHEPGQEGKITGKSLILYRGKDLLTRITLGKSREKTAPSPNQPVYKDGTYVRRGEEAKVYLVKENLELDLDPANWMKTKVLGYDQKELASFALQRGQEAFKLVRKEPGKDLELEGQEATKLNQDQLVQLVQAVEKLEVDNALSPAQAKALVSKPVAQVRLTLFDGSVIGLDFAQVQADQEQNQNYLITLNQVEGPEAKKLAPVTGWVFQLNSWSAEKWLKPKADYLKP